MEIISKGVTQIMAKPKTDDVLEVNKFNFFN